MRKLKLPGRDVSRPRLDEQDIVLIQSEGIAGIKKMARDIIEAKLREQPDNDGSQTPIRGNPVYKAMHATNCASRKELSLAHRMPAGRRLTDNQFESVVNLVVRWIVREYNFYREEENQQKNLSDFNRSDT